MLASGITYEDLYMALRNGLRNGNWRRLSFLDRALYRASLWYSKYRGGIVNEQLVEKLSEFIKRLKETRATRIFERGSKKAVEMLRMCGEQKRRVECLYGLLN
jgi:CRISPR/Cas system CSM-associated protein Csm2 small subunit